MAKVPVIEEHQLQDMISIAAVTGQSPARDAALLSVLYGTGVLLAELVGLQVADFLTEHGQVRVRSAVRSEIAHNSIERPLFWTSRKVVAAVDAYLADRLVRRHGVAPHERLFRGLDPSSALFLKPDGLPYGLTGRKLQSGDTCYSCDAMGQVIRKLHSQAGADGSANAARRTFAVRLYRKGYDLSYIATLLGLQTLTATRKLIDSDTVDLGTLVADVL
jgi:site-specific recombinase XerD